MAAKHSVAGGESSRPFGAVATGEGSLGRMNDADTNHQFHTAPNGVDYRNRDLRRQLLAIRFKRGAGRESQCVVRRGDGRTARARAYVSMPRPDVRRDAEFADLRARRRPRGIALGQRMRAIANRAVYEMARPLPAAGLVA